MSRIISMLANGIEQGVYAIYRVTVTYVNTDCKDVAERVYQTASPLSPPPLTREDQLSHFRSFRHPSTLNPLKSRRFVACVLTGTLAASLVPQPVHAETADHTEHIAVAAAPVAQTGIETQGCPDEGAGACVVSGFNVSIGINWFISITIDRVLECVSCDCIWTYRDSNGNLRLHREHWIDCDLL